MKKLTAVMVAAAALGAGVAGAQTWQDENGTFTFTGCYKSDSFVRCEVNYTLTKKDTGRLGWSNSDMIYYLSNGTTGRADTLSMAGGYFYGTGAVDIIKGVPIKTVFQLELPSDTKNILALLIDKKRFDNVPVRSSATAAAPAPAPRPAAPAPAAAPVNTGNYNAVLTECKPGAGGVLTCKAVLTPRR